MFELTSRLLNNLGYIIAIAFFFTKFKSARNIFSRKKYTQKDIFFLTAFFSILSIVGTYIGVDYKGSIVNTRNIGVVVGGIIAGPEVGIFTGIISGIHRFCIDTGAFTTTACSLATMLSGFITAFLYKKTNEKNCFIYGFIGGFLSETLSMLFIILMGTDFNLAVDIVSEIYFPMVLANAIGVSMVILIIEDIISEKDIEAGKQAKLALEIANKSLPYFRNGESLNEVCKIILNSLEAKAVVITNRNYVIASYSKNDDYKISYDEIKSKETKEVLKTGKIMVLGNVNDDIIHQYISKKIKSCMILPLFEENKVAGTLKIYFDAKESVTARKQQLAEGLSMLISTQLEISNVENFKNMAREAELKALQTQINPHFLFNSLNTIASFVRIDPTKAREVIIDLSTYLRYNLENSSKLVPLYKEIEQVQAFVNIEQARFGDKINVSYHIPDDLKDIQIPSLTIQPLVENSIKHGILKQREKGFIDIIAKKYNRGCIITITDNGIGISEDIIKSLDEKIEKNIGLRNVHNRIKLRYGKGLLIKKLEKGTEISFYIE